MLNLHPISRAWLAAFAGFTGDAPVFTGAAGTAEVRDWLDTERATLVAVTGHAEADALSDWARHSSPPDSPAMLMLCTLPRSA